ncbi:MAG: hypothetical protein ABIJ82_02720, partial [Patescibacteria group bacterium]
AVIDFVSFLPVLSTLATGRNYRVVAHVHLLSLLSLLDFVAGLYSFSKRASNTTRYMKNVL